MSKEQMTLRLSGLVRSERGKLKVYNQLYREVFDEIWVKDQLSNLVPDKQIKAVVEEVFKVFTKGEDIKKFGLKHHFYINTIPYTWLEKFPWDPEKPKVVNFELSPHEMITIEENINKGIQAQVIGLDELRDIIENTDIRRQEDLNNSCENETLQARNSDILPLDNQTFEYIKQCLIDSGTIKIVFSRGEKVLFSLNYRGYSPPYEKERLYVLIEDSARYFRMLKRWQERHPGVMRIFESLCIRQEKVESAFKELDELIVAWADKYHDSSGVHHIIQMVAGPRFKREGK